MGCWRSHSLRLGTRCDEGKVQISCRIFRVRTRRTIFWFSAFWNEVITWFWRCAHLQSRRLTIRSPHNLGRLKVIRRDSIFEKLVTKWKINIEIVAFSTILCKCIRFVEVILKLSQNVSSVIRDEAVHPAEAIELKNWFWLPFLSSFWWRSNAMLLRSSPFVASEDECKTLPSSSSNLLLLNFEELLVAEEGLVGIDRRGGGIAIVVAWDGDEVEATCAGWIEGLDELSWPLVVEDLGVLSWALAIL